MLNNGVIGQRVRAIKDLLEENIDDLIPAHYVARRGDTLVIRKVRSRYAPSGWAYHVSHEDVTNSSFGVSEGEIEAIDAQTGSEGE